MRSASPRRRHRLPSRSPPFNQRATPPPSLPHRFERADGRRPRRFPSPNDIGTTPRSASPPSRDSRDSGPSPSGSNQSEERRRSDSRSKSPPAKRIRYEGGASSTGEGSSGKLEEKISEDDEPNSSKVDLREFLKKKKNEPKEDKRPLSIMEEL